MPLDRRSYVKRKRAGSLVLMHHLRHPIRYAGSRPTRINCCLKYYLPVKISVWFCRSTQSSPPLLRKNRGWAPERGGIFQCLSGLKAMDAQCTSALPLSLIQPPPHPFQIIVCGPWNHTAKGKNGVFGNELVTSSPTCHIKPEWANILQRGARVPCMFWLHSLFQGKKNKPGCSVTAWVKMRY